MNKYLWVYCVRFTVADFSAIGGGITADIRWFMITNKWKSMYPLIYNNG